MNVHFTSGAGQQTPQRLLKSPADPLSPGQEVVRFGGKRRRRFLAGLAGVLGSVALVTPSYAASNAPSQNPPLPCSDTTEAVNDTFSFRFKVPSTEAGAKDGYIETKTPTADQREVEKLTRVTLADMFSCAPDRLEQLQDFPDGLFIDLYEGRIPGDEDKAGVASLLATVGADGTRLTSEAAISLDIPKTIVSMKVPIAGYDVVRHEVTHILEYMEGVEKQSGYSLMEVQSDGLFPEWAADPQLRQQYIQAREAAKILIAQGKSPLGQAHKGSENYALTSDNEFLSVLTETYFTLPDELKKVHPELYTLVDTYFGNWVQHTREAARQAASDNKSDAENTGTSQTGETGLVDKVLDKLPPPSILVMGGLVIATGSGGAIYLIRRRKQSAQVQVVPNYQPDGLSQPLLPWETLLDDKPPPTPLDW